MKNFTNSKRLFSDLRNQSKTRSKEVKIIPGGGLMMNLLNKEWTGKKDSIWHNRMVAWMEKVWRVKIDGQMKLFLQVLRDFRQRCVNITTNVRK